MTRDGYNRIRAEIDKMENVDMPAITEKLAEARAEGDLKENAEYHAQRENQGMLQAKIGALKGKLANAHIVDPSQMPKGEVAFGATVTVKDLDDGEEEAYTLVGAGDEDYDVGKILLTSPIGVALVQKKVGEKVEIAVPSGVLKYEVMKIEYKGM
jgi:transcription elongation factor GreA